MEIYGIQGKIVIAKLRKSRKLPPFWMMALTVGMDG